MSPGSPPLIAAILTALLIASCGEEEPAGFDMQQVGDPPQRLRLAITATMHGKLEPCGCASAQTGGLARRIFHLRQARHHDLLIEGGNMVKTATPLDGLKFWTALEILNLETCRYHVQGIGPGDLALDPLDLFQFTSGTEVAVLASDLEVLEAPEGEQWAGKRFEEVTTDNGTARIASLVLSLPEGNERFRLTPPATAWRQAMAGVGDATYRILLVHGSKEQAYAMARLTPRPDLVIGCTAEFLDPVQRPHDVDGVPVVFPGIEGRHILDVSLWRGAGGPQVSLEDVRLEGSRTQKGFAEDREVRGLLLLHRQTVADMEIRELMAEQIPTPGGRQYVGSERCGTCHQKAYDIWQGTKHARAWRTLADAEKDPKRYGWPVTRYPDCIACHTVGYGFKSGFVNPEKTPYLKAVGCEQCHGPGNAHCDTPLEVKMGPVGGQMCFSCHDHDQSPEFEYSARWPAIGHGK